MRHHAHTNSPAAATDEAPTHTYTHTAWKWRKVRIRFSLCLSLGEPPGQHRALDVPELEALEAMHARTLAHTHTRTHKSKCPLPAFLYQVHIILQCESCRTLVSTSQGAMSFSKHATQRQQGLQASGCCSMCMLLKDNRQSHKR